MTGTSGLTTGTKIDLGTIVKPADGSWDVLRPLSQEITDEKRMQYLTFHCKPSKSDILHSHQVTKGKKTWKVSFQSKWIKQFPWLCFSYILEGGINFVVIVSYSLKADLHGTTLSHTTSLRQAYDRSTTS